MNGLKNIIACAFFGAVVLGAFSAVAVPQGRWCTTWRTQFNDSNFGEDYFNTTANTDRQARYSAYKVEYKSGSNWYSLPGGSGYLDSSSCTSYYTISGLTEYRFTQYTRMYRSTGRWICVIPDFELLSPSCPAHYQDWEITTGRLSTSGVYTFTRPSTTLTDEGRVTPVFSRLLQYGNTLAYQSDTIVYVKSTEVARDVDCYPNDGSHYNYLGDDEHLVCLSQNHLNDKFVQAHEFGHAIARMNNGPRRGDYEGDTGAFADTDPDERCECLHISATSSHCLGSREFIGSGYKEGWSHFIGAFIFNYRSMGTGTGGFAYYKKVLKPSGNPTGDFWWPPFGVNISPDISTDYERWMKFECNPGPAGYESLGTEWDWLQFFWTLYAQNNTGGRFDVDEIMDVWDGIDDYLAKQCCNGTSCTIFPNDSHTCTLPAVETVVGKRWDDLRDEAEAIHGSGSDESDHFDLMGQYAGVDY